MRAFGGTTYLRADLPVRQEEAEAQRSREMSAALLKTFGPVSHSLGKIVLAIHSQSLDAAITTSTMCQRVSRCFGKCPLHVRTHRHHLGIPQILCPTRLGKNSEGFRELMYDSVYDESCIQERREPGTGQPASCPD